MVGGRSTPFPLLQMVASGRPDRRCRHRGALLTMADVPAMMDLVAVAEPGPFGPRTSLLGRYLGIRQAERLVAMAGERLRRAGPCRAERDLRSPRSARAGIRRRSDTGADAAAFERGEVPFLHVRPDNVARSPSTGAWAS